VTVVPTPSQTVGPFFRFAFDWMASGQVVAPGSPGALTVWGRVLDGAGEPVPDAVVEAFQAGPVPRFGRACTDPSGVYRFVTVKPGRVDDRQAPHLELSVFARGLLQRLWTRCYFPDESAANAADPLLLTIADPARAATLVAVAGSEGLQFDIFLQGDPETVFFDW
jgi:protocatechuate 3,4-dioxygenase alpha subunit